jgi:hypothetical protein
VSSRLDVADMAVIEAKEVLARHAIQIFEGDALSRRVRFTGSLNQGVSGAENPNPASAGV